MIETTAKPVSTISPLQQDILLLQNIRTLLLTEQSHLERAEAWALPELTRQKQQLAEALDLRYSEREPALRAANLPLTVLGMRSWLQQHQPAQSSAQFNREWEQFLRLAREIQSLNFLNGRLIELHLQQIGSRLQNLTQSAGIDSTYGANGLSGRPNVSRAHTAA